ncbi:MAG: guanylate cyclase [Deltaproteobacteria bacterium HGW-Deltaproteobacteria-15]|jgi:class 3 adenylate cyclase|nr:MAG: guanylate cyclase [Deltaproteobacteria bacterium HGW-Deltaproteobacteria-15]
MTPSYKERFENLLRVVKKVTSSLDPGDILEVIRDEAKVTVPYAKEACLLMFDPEAKYYTRPLHCSLSKERINCQLCKKGGEHIQKALKDPVAFECAPQSSASAGPICEVAFPIWDGGGKPLAVLDVISDDKNGFHPKDIVLLKDLTDLATNAILNARRHWKLSQERLTLDSILKHIRPFVPDTVNRILEKDPFTPVLDKKEADVSVLFLDVASYTKISERLTREKVNFVLEKYFSSFLDEINHHGGDINETAGDGLMAIFQGQESENGLNACKAALHIRERTLEINRELEGRFQPVHVNMGINSGIAYLGMTRFQGETGTRMTFTASGPVTNLAARIASAAKRGDILIGPETARRVEGEIPLFDRGLMKFKNVKDKVKVYSLVGPGPRKNT